MSLPSNSSNFNFVLKFGPVRFPSKSKFRALTGLRVLNFAKARSGTITDKTVIGSAYIRIKDADDGGDREGAGTEAMLNDLTSV